MIQNKRCTRLFMLCIIAHSILNGSTIPESYVKHVQTSIENALQAKSKLTDSILQLPGMSSPRVRHFLNNLCSLQIPGTQLNYLEIGCWKGSTLISALYENQHTLNKAIAIDNWTEFYSPTVRSECLGNVQTYLSGYPLQFIEDDCFALKKDIFSQNANKINIYFYDGHHSAQSQEKALTYYAPVLADICIVVIDDWNWADVRKGTRAALAKIDYQVLYEREFFTAGNDAKDWWNGLYVAVICKKDLAAAHSHAQPARSTNAADTMPEPYRSIKPLPFNSHGWFQNAPQLKELIIKNQVKIIIEVGTWLGASARYMAALIPEDGKLYAVDNWLGCVEQQPGGSAFIPSIELRTSYLHFLSNVIHAGLAHKIVPIRMNSLDAARALNIVPDLIYIDASHDTDSVYKDLSAWYPFVQGHGIICGDDWGWPTVAAAVSKFVAEHPELRLQAAGSFWVFHRVN